MSTTGEPTPISANRGKGGLPGEAAAMGTARVHRQSSGRKLRTESFYGAKKSAKTVYEN